MGEALQPADLVVVLADDTRVGGGALADVDPAVGDDCLNAIAGSTGDVRRVAVPGRREDRFAGPVRGRQVEKEDCPGGPVQTSTSSRPTHRRGTNRRRMADSPGTTRGKTSRVVFT